MRLGSKAAFVPVFLPTTTRSLQGWSKTKNYLVVTVLDTVKTCLQVLSLADGKW